jgi:hypothetical protein
MNLQRLPLAIWRALAHAGAPHVIDAPRPTEPAATAPIVLHRARYDDRMLLQVARYAIRFTSNHAIWRWVAHGQPMLPAKTRK